MKFEMGAVPFKPKDVIVGSAIGGITTILIGPFGIFAGLLAIAYGYVKRSNKALFAGITMTLMGIAYFASTMFTDMLPSPMLIGYVPKQTVIKNTIVKGTGGGVASAFRVVNGIPDNLKQGDVWFNTQDTQFEGYDGSDVVILG